MKNMIKNNATDYVACGEAAGKYLYGEKLFKRIMKSQRTVLISEDSPFSFIYSLLTWFRFSHFYRSTNTKSKCWQQ